jgi:hypothetical protein
MHVVGALQNFFHLSPFKSYKTFPVTATDFLTFAEFFPLAAFLGYSTIDAGGFNSGGTQRKCE